MALSENQKSYSLIVGMGATGFSIAQFLSDKGHKFHIFDTRSSSNMQSQFNACFPEAEQYFEQIDRAVVDGAAEIYISPGVPRDETVIASAIASGKSVVGDIELFLRQAQKPVIGITGSNGKSTVTTLVGLAAEKAGLQVGVGGNIGTPALELLREDADLYVLELSSFQLESTLTPNLHVACNLNISADHMDRYDDLQHYITTKQQIFIGASHTVFNLDDSLTHPPVEATETGIRYGFGLNRRLEKNERQYSFCAESGWLEIDGDRLLHKDEIKIKGKHNICNALALFAIADAAGVSRDACKYILGEFEGLPHRCEYVAEQNGVTYINDSKATNVGATKAAIDGLASEFENIVLIAGGEGKGTEFNELGECINETVAAVVLFGKDRDQIAKLLASHVSIVLVDNMTDAVQSAKSKAKKGDLVLLSPACASFDMFSNFEHRGQAFIDAVNGGAGQ